MMHQTIKVNSKILTRIRYLAYSIPIGCIMTMMMGLAFIPQSEAYAASEVCDDLPSGYHYVSNGMPCNMEPILTPTETFTIDKTTSTSPTASLKIDNSTSAITDKINSSYGVTNYASHTVSVSVTEAGSYSLILSGPAQLSGPSAINATSGATGASLANDTWGYAWENTTVTDANANYKALGSSINLAGNALSNRATSFSKKLVFAAKFDKAAAGIYHADVSLSLVATPEYTTTTVTATNAVPWDKLVFMQDMTNYACMQADIGDSKTLKDVRDNNAYTVVKLSDGKCWMTQNLRLSKETLKTNLYSLTIHDTNLTKLGVYYYPPTSTTSFSSTDPNAGQISKSTDTAYGAYYSFNAATASTATSLSTGNAPGDICPKGWRLPTGGSGGEFEALKSKGSIKVGTWSSGSTTAGHWIGGMIANVTAGGAFFPAAGVVNTSGSDYSGLYGYYWSRTISNHVYIYTLWFNNDHISLDNFSNRGAGLSIRCIAK